MTKPIHPQIEKLFTEKTGSFQFNINYSWRNNQDLFDFCYDIWQKAQDEILNIFQILMENHKCGHGWDTSFYCDRCQEWRNDIKRKLKELRNRKEKPKDD
jgi:hypothetical protein